MTRGATSLLRLTSLLPTFRNIIWSWDSVQQECGYVDMNCLWLWVLHSIGLLHRLLKLILLVEMQFPSMKIIFNFIPVCWGVSRLNKLQGNIGITLSLGFWFLASPKLLVPSASFSSSNQVWAALRVTTFLTSSPSVLCITEDISKCGRFLLLFSSRSWLFYSATCPFSNPLPHEEH